VEEEGDTEMDFFTMLEMSMKDGSNNYGLKEEVTKTQQNYFKGSQS
jgi:hypothetical protein